MKNKLAVVIGRFQTPYLHKGHLKLIGEAKKASDDVLILIGCTDAVGTDKNPLDYKTRKNMFYGTHTLSIVRSLPDCPSDEEWSASIDSIIENLGYDRAVILGGRDNSIEDSYLGKHPMMIIDDYGGYSATTLRKLIGERSPKGDEFRRGIIYHVENRHSIVYSTVDVVLLDNTERGVLMGKKGNKFHFIGGFVDPSDNNLREAARRELLEETGIIKDLEDLEYYDSMKINDARYKGTKDSIMTHIFVGYQLNLPDMSEILDREFAEFRFIKKSERDLVSDSHKPIFDLFNF